MECRGLEKAKDMNEHFSSALTLEGGERTVDWPVLTFRS